MRLFVMATLLVRVLLIAFTSTRASAQGVHLQAGIVSGETLTLFKVRGDLIERIARAARR